MSRPRTSEATSRLAPHMQTPNAIPRRAQQQSWLAVEVGLPSPRSRGGCIHEQEPDVAFIDRNMIQAVLAMRPNVICTDRPHFDHDGTRRRKLRGPVAREGGRSRIYNRARAGGGSSRRRQSVWTGVRSTKGTGGITLNGCRTRYIVESLVDEHAEVVAL